MRAFFGLSLLCIVGIVQCGVLPSSQIISTLPSAVTTSQRIGGNFAYSTVESRAQPSIVHSPIALSYAAPLPVAQSPYYQSIFGSPFLNPIIQHPFYPGIVGQAPVAGQNPIFGQPIFGQYPGQGQIPAQPPVAAPPQGVPQGPAPPPPGAVVDDDTVSVEAA